MQINAQTIRNFLNINHATSPNEPGFLQSLYPELKRLARSHMSRERANHTLCPTALVSEAYLKLSQSKELSWIDKNHFLALSSRCIRQILVDYSREKSAQKRGGGQTMLTLKEEITGDHNNQDVDLLALHELLDKLATRDETQANIVEMRFFSGMTNEEVALALEISPATVKRKWTMAKAWLYKELN